MNNTDPKQTMTEAASPGINSSDAILTVHDLVLLYRLSSGSTNAEIGMSLARSEKTVRNQLTRLYRKLGVVNRAQAVAVYLRDLLSPSRPDPTAVTRSGHSSHWSSLDSRLRSAMEAADSAGVFSTAVEPAAREETR